MSRYSKRDEQQMLSKWYKLAHRVWDHFALGNADKLQAIYAARRSPKAALRAYRAIAASLR